MKRGKPLERRTPLRSNVPLTSHCELQRREPIKPVSDKRRRENVEWRHVVSAMREVARGRCARCGRRDLPVRGHERLARAHGGDIIHPDALLDDLCNSWCEDSPRVAAWTGWKVSSKWPHDPALEPWEARALNGDVIDLRVFQCEVVS